MSADLERELRELAVAWPATPDLEAAVAARLEPRAPRSSRRLRAPLPSRRLRAPGPLSAGWAFGRRPVLVSALLIALAVAAGTLAVSPEARSALLEFLGLRGARIERREPAPRLGTELGLGRPVTLAAARRQAGFAVPVPGLSGLEAPDGVFLTGRRVSLVYGERPGITRSPRTGAALLVTAFPASVEPVIGKAAGPDTTVERLTIDRNPAYWLSGAPHGFAWIDPDTQQATFEDQRLAGNTLLVERSDGLLLRVEGDVSRDRAVAVVRSMRPG
jgi:hypothetical protein